MNPPRRTLFSLLLLFGAASSGFSTPSASSPPVDQAAPPPPTVATISPIEAIMRAAETPAGISGVFQMEVRAGGRQNGWLYLNSELDYRDQRNLTIAFPPSVVPALVAKLGGDPIPKLKGRTICIIGTAKRVTIWFVADGVRTNSYYYQTHVNVSDVTQVAVLP
jgi:hypothetical protein